MSSDRDRYRQYIVERDALSALSEALSVDVVDRGDVSRCMHHLWLTINKRWEVAFAECVSRDDRPSPPRLMMKDLDALSTQAITQAQWLMSQGVCPDKAWGIVSESGSERVPIDKRVEIDTNAASDADKDGAT